MAKKIKIQHLYTTTGTTAPTGNLVLDYGEISISHTRGQEAIFIMSDENDGEVKFIPKTQIVSLIDTKLGEAGVATEGVISALTANLENHITGNTADSTNSGHVKLVNEDLNDGKFTTGNWDGYATGVKHTHSQYLSGVTAGSGQPIVSIIEDGVAKIGLTTGITNQINSGVSGYTRIEAHEPISATTEDIGHVKLVGGDLSGKTGDVINGEAAAASHTHSQYFAKVNISDGLETWKKYDDSREMLKVKAADNGGITVNTSGVSINSELKEKWDNASSAITAFLKDANLTGNAVDTLIEIQQFLDGTGSTVQTLLDNLSDLTDTVSGNTDSISDLNADINALKDESPNYVKTLIGDDHIKADKLPGVSQQWVLTHNSASTENATITATNDTTGLSFGSEFKIVDKIGYDANGHVVSGSTQILKLPVVPQASSGVSGIVTTTYGDLKDYTDIPTKSQLYYAAHRNHTHSQYVRLADLSGNTGDIITISCGTY